MNRPIDHARRHGRIYIVTLLNSPAVYYFYNIQISCLAVCRLFSRSFVRDVLAIITENIFYEHLKHHHPKSSSFANIEGFRNSSFWLMEIMLWLVFPIPLTNQFLLPARFPK